MLKLLNKMRISRKVHMRPPPIFQLEIQICCSNFLEFLIFRRVEIQLRIHMNFSRISSVILRSDQKLVHR